MPQIKLPKKVLLVITLFFFSIMTLFGVVIFRYVNNPKNSTSNDPRANAGLTNSPIDQKYGEIAGMLQDIAEPLFNRDILPTFNSIESQNANVSPEEIADKKAQTLCSTKPVGATDPELWAQWRGCVGAGHIILSNHYTRLFIKSHNEADRAKATTSLYMMSTYLDTLITGSEYNLVSGIELKDPIFTYKLRDTFQVSRYLSDSNGFQSAYGFGYSNGTLVENYCTTQEKPYDTNRNCKTINLIQRAKIINSGIAAKIASEWIIHSDGTLRTEFWNNNEYWNKANSGTPYMVTPNTVFDPSHGIGWYDLSGRRTMSKVTHTHGVDPYFFTWTMAGMTDAAKLASADGGIFKFIYDFGINAAGYGIDFDPNNLQGDFATLNDYGVPLKGLSSFCDGTTNLLSKDLLGICEGGTREVYEAGRSKNEPTGLVPLTYNVGQHLGTNMADLNWSTLPAPYNQNAMNYYHAYKATTTKDGKSYVDLSNGGFNENTMKQYIPNYIKSSCRTAESENYQYYKNPATGRVVSGTGETAAELFATLIPTVAHIVSQKDMVKAIGILDEYKTLVSSIKTNPLSASDSSCSGGNWIGSSPVARSLFQYNNLVFGYFQFRKTPIPALPATLSLPTTKVKLPQMNTAILPDQIKWGSFASTDLSQSALFNGKLPLDTRIVFQGLDQKWYDGLTKANIGWNRITDDYSQYNNPNLNYLPVGGIDLTSSFPAGSVPYDTRVLYKDFDGTMKEGITKGNQTWSRTIPTWFNPGPWSTSDLSTLGVPAEVLPPDSRTTYMSDTGLLTDIWIKGETVMYHTFTSTSRASNWIKLNVRSFGLPPELWNGIDTMTTWKNPSGQWVQSITKGTIAWTRYSSTAPALQYLPQQNQTTIQPISPAPTITPTPSTTVTVSPSPTTTTTPSKTPIPTISQTIAPTKTPSVTPTITKTPTPKPTVTVSPVNTVTPTLTKTPTPTITVTKTPTPTVTTTSTVTPTKTPSITPTSTVSVTPSTGCALHGEGDANCDSSIDLLDFEQFRQEFIKFRQGTLDINTAKADFNNDKSVDIADFAIFRDGYLKYKAK